MGVLEVTGATPNSFGILSFGREGATPGFQVDTDGGSIILGGQSYNPAQSNIVPGKNLFDSAGTYGANTFWNGVGTSPITLAGWYASARIAVTVGQTYTINNCRNYQTMDASGNPITYVNNPSQAPVTFTIPAGVSTVGYNVSSANLATSQMEVGSSVTTYEPFGYQLLRQLVGGVYLTDIASNVGSLARMPGVTVYRSSNEMLVRAAFDATRDILLPWDISHGLETAVVMASDTNPFVTLVPSSTSDSLVWPTVSTGTAIHGASDDNCPINNGSWSYVGGNHGYSSATTVTMAGHDKTTADLGSRWSDGTRTYTLLSITDSSHLVFGHQYTTSSGISTGSTIAPAATLTHVAGATHTADVTITGGTALAQINPSTHSHSVSVALDGRDVATGKSSGQVLTITETYLIVSYKGLIDTAQANIGTPVSSIITTVPSLCRVSNTYRVSGAQIVVSQRVTAIEKFTINMGVTQALPLTVYPGGSKKQFMAGVGTVGGLNFSTYADLSTMAADIDIAPANYLNVSQPASSMVQWVYDSGAAAQYGLAMGILPVQDGHPLVRVKNTATKSWFMPNSTKKQYPQLAWAKTLNVGDSLAGTAYRRYLAPPDTSTEITVSDGSDTWVIIERPTTASDVRMQAPALLGRRLVPVGSPTVLAADRVAGDGIGYSVASAPGYGIWRASDEPPRLDTIPGATYGAGTYFIWQGAVSTLALTGSYQILYLMPLYVPEATPVDRVAMEVTTLGTGVIRHGVYATDPSTGQPNLKGPLIDFGTIDVTSTGIKELTIATTLPASWHWHGFVWQADGTTAPTIRILTTTAGIGPLNIGTSNTPMTGARLGFYQTGVTGALGALTLTAAHQLTPARLAYRRA